MPTPNKNETRNEYISRCVKEVMKEGKKQDQALGQCYGMWDQHKKKAAASLDIGLDDEVLFFEEENNENEKEKS